jgi:hypothetical protein
LRQLPGSEFGENEDKQNYYKSLEERQVEAKTQIIKVYE